MHREPRSSDATTLAAQPEPCAIPLERATAGSCFSLNTTPGFSSEHVLDVGLVVLDQHVRILSEPRSLVQRHLLDAPDSRLSVVPHGEGTDLVGDVHKFIVGQPLEVVGDFHEIRRGGGTAPRPEAVLPRQPFPSFSKILRALAASSMEAGRKSSMPTPPSTCCPKRQRRPS